MKDGVALTLLALLVAACSSTVTGTGTGSSADAETACERLGDLCAELATTRTDCSKANDEYDGLSSAKRQETDELIDCIMDADSCDQVLKCSKTSGSSDDDVDDGSTGFGPGIGAADAADACRHAKVVCEELSDLDCSKANREYEVLSSAEKARADAQIDCMLDAINCEEIASCAR